MRRELYVIDGNLNFTRVADTLDPRIDFHDMQIGPPGRYKVYPATCLEMMLANGRVRGLTPTISGVPFDLNQHGALPFVLLCDKTES